MGAARPHTPGFCGGYPPPRPGVHFWTPKSEPKNRQNQGFGFLCLIGLYQIWDIPATELGFCHLIYSGSIDETSASGPVKEMDVSVDACRNMVLETYPREYPKKFRVGLIYAGGIPNGASPL